MSKWSVVFAHMIVIRSGGHGRGLDGLLGRFGGVLGCNTQEAFPVTRLTVGASNGLQMAWNLTGGLPVVYQSRLANLGPFRESLTTAHEKRQKGAPENIGVPDRKTDNGENALMHEMNTYANEMPMMT